MKQIPSIYNLDQPWYREPELCSWLMISRHTFRRWRKKGLHSVGKGRLWRYYWPTVLAWLEIHDTKLR